MVKSANILILLMLSGCASTEKYETVVNKHTWVWCWNACGKGDRLAAVSNSACVCSNGGVIAMQPQFVEPVGPGLYDRLLSFLKGD